MQQLPFFFSHERKWRYARHLCFWVLWFLFQLLLYSFTPSAILQQQTFWRRIVITFPEAFLFLFPSIFLAYSLMYLVIPKLVLPGRYVMAIIGSLVLMLLTATFAAFLSVTVVDAFRHLVADRLSPVLAKEAHPPFYVQIGVAMLAGLRGSITIGGVAAAVKLLKCFFEKQQAALILEKERTKIELQMLKAQLHPHFLFNTLNNVYSLTQDVSAKASGMIMGLSQLLRYMLYDCDKPMVPLDKELKMTRDYLELETVRYDHQLDISLQLPQQGGHLFIAPLILLPFLENAFKHGASRMVEQPWISMHINITGRELSMKLINGKCASAHTPAAGIGIINVRQRLQLLYPGTHDLQIDDLEEMYIVNLKMTLDIASYASEKPFAYGAAKEI